MRPVGISGFSVPGGRLRDRKSTRLNSSHGSISYAVFCLKKKKMLANPRTQPRSDPERAQEDRGISSTQGAPASSPAPDGGAPRRPPGHVFFFNDTATTEIYTLSLHDALPI